MNVMLFLALCSDAQTMAIAENNAAAVAFVKFRKDTEFQSLLVKPLVDHYEKVKDTMSAGDLETYLFNKAKFDAHFVDAVASRSAARVSLLKCGKYIIAATGAATVVEANQLYLYAIEEAAKVKSLTSTTALSDAQKHFNAMADILKGY